MSNVNVMRAVENIKANTTVYTPIIEVIVNAIHAIESSSTSDGKIEILLTRAAQTQFDIDNSTQTAVESIKVRDNGIGFNQENINSFDTLYSDRKEKIGGKGFGRFTCLKYFNDLHIESIYDDNDQFKKVNFSMGKRNEIIINKQIILSDLNTSGSVVHLSSIKNNENLPKNLETIAKNLVEKLLPYFITKDSTCPKITLSEADNSNSIILNSYTTADDAFIQEISLPTSEFHLGSDENCYSFNIRTFKIFSPRTQKSKVTLVAHYREVTSTSIDQYIPEFSDDFYEQVESSESGRNYIIKSYVFSNYLDNNVSLERGSFDFEKENDLICGISQNEIERKAAELTKI